MITSVTQVFFIMNLIPKAFKLNYERIKVAFGIRDTDKWERTGQYLILS